MDAAPSPLVVVSNRGPLAFTMQGDRLLTRKAAGGLVSALAPALEGVEATWIAGAITDADRRAAAQGAVDSEAARVRLLTLDEGDYRAYYDIVANSTLWYLYHGLYDRPRRPFIDRRWREAWARYRDVNLRFAEAVVEHSPQDAVVLVQDYHLSLLAPHVTKQRPDLRTVHFHHTPFCGPEDLRMLPDDVAAELVGGLASHGACGFHTRRWADAFSACCEAVLGDVPLTFVAPAAPDLDDVARVAAGTECDGHLADLEARVGDRQLIVRVDRIELSKNLLRGFHAYDELLETRPQWRGRVIFGAFVYPSRETLPDYLGYRAEVEALIARINAKWQTPAWTPIMVEATDNFPASVAALRRYDVLLVNPVRDGLNLVAKEGAAVNERDGVLALSRESGVWDELGPWALELNPFDLTATAEALHTALTMAPEERAERATGLRAAATRRGPSDWLAQQVAAAG
ncbi:MAG: trehalose-6-phosphate synthase [Actinobacteria bacterium]|nr:trehalose-6-phosphate synthase [Actinomycetota bacterium]MBW3650165.1 trehalose-6-phosphate synthase [Actinomycetota bacterium]